MIADFGANKTLTGGLALQTVGTYREWIGANDAQLYFEEEDFDAFIHKLDSQDIAYVHPVKEHSWGQRAVCFYDPGRHIIEVGEDIQAVCRRFFSGGKPPVICRIKGVAAKQKRRSNRLNVLRKKKPGAVLRDKHSKRHRVLCMIGGYF